MINATATNTTVFNLYSWSFRQTAFGEIPPISSSRSRQNVVMKKLFSDARAVIGSKIISAINLMGRKFEPQNSIDC